MLMLDASRIYWANVDHRYSRRTSVCCLYLPVLYKCLGLENRTVSFTTDLDTLKSSWHISEDFINTISGRRKKESKGGRRKRSKEGEKKVRDEGEEGARKVVKLGWSL